MPITPTTFFGHRPLSAANQFRAYADVYLTDPSTGVRSPTYYEMTRLSADVADLQPQREVVVQSGIEMNTFCYPEGDLPSDLTRRRYLAYRCWIATKERTPQDGGYANDAQATRRLDKAERSGKRCGGLS